MIWHWLWPIRTGQTLLDGWSLVVLLFWFMAGSVIAAKTDRLGHYRWLRFVLPSLISWTGSAAWEFFDKHAERWWPHFFIWEHPEVFLNRVGDGLMSSLGLLIAYIVYERYRHV